MLSIHVHNDLYTFSNPYTLSTLGHSCIITLLVVCCISVASSGFSMIVQWDNEVLQIVKTCPKLCFFKTGSSSVHVQEFSWTASVRWSQELLRICIRKWMHPPSTHLLWTLVKSETADHVRFSGLDAAGAHAVDSRWRLALADYVLTRLRKGRDTLTKASSVRCRSSAVSERILAIAHGLGSAQCRL